MRDEFRLSGEFSGRRYEHVEVLREIERGDPEGVRRAREKALKLTLAAGGVLLPSFAIADAFAAGNTVSLEWYDLVFDSMIKGDAYTENVRMGVFGNDVSPADSLVITTFRATLGEATGFTVDSGNATNRATTTFAASSSQSITNSAAPSRFTFTGSDTIYGAFLTQGATLKDGSQDSDPAVYIAGAKFGASQPVSSGSIIDVVYTQSKT